MIKIHGLRDRLQCPALRKHVDSVPSRFPSETIRNEPFPPLLIFLDASFRRHDRLEVDLLHIFVSVLSARVCEGLRLIKKSLDRYDRLDSLDT